MQNKMNVTILLCPSAQPHLHWRGIRITSHSDGHWELLHEDRKRPQFPWEHKVKEGPKFLKVILHGWARENEPVRGPKLGKKTETLTKLDQTKANV